MFTPALAVVRIFLPFKSWIVLMPVSGLTMIASVPIASMTPTEISGAPPATRLIIEAHDP